MVQQFHLNYSKSLQLEVRRAGESLKTLRILQSCVKTLL